MLEVALEHSSPENEDDQWSKSCPVLLVVVLVLQSTVLT